MNRDGSRVDLVADLLCHFVAVPVAFALLGAALALWFTGFRPGGSP